METKNYLLTEAEAKEILAPLAQIFYDAIQAGFEDFRTIQKSGKPFTSPTAKATAVWDYIVQHLTRLAARESAMRLVTSQKMVLVVVRDKIGIRIKKYSKNFRPANIVTKQVTNFRGHNFSLSEKQALYPIDIAYRVNLLFTEIDDIHYVCPNGLTENLWKIAIEPTDVARVKPLVISPEVEQDFVPVVKLKTDTDQDAKTGTDS